MCVAAVVMTGLGALALLIDTSIGHRMIADQVGALRPANGLRYSVGRIEGSVWSKAVLHEVRVRDPRGLVLSVPRATLDWRPLAWLTNRLQIVALDIPAATLVKLPEPVPGARKGPVLPSFDITVGRLVVDRLLVGRAVTGTARSGRLAARAEVRGQRAMVRLDARIAGSDALALTLDAVPDRDEFDIDVAANAARGGLLARVSGIGQPFRLTVRGDGRWSRWRGVAVGELAGAPTMALRLANDAGRYAVDGTVRAGGIARGLAARLLGERVAVSGSATLANRIVDGALTLRSSALRVEAMGGIDLGERAFRHVRARAGLRDPAALAREWRGRDVELRAVIDGGFDRAAIDYRLRAARIAFGGAEGFEDVRAAGLARLGRGAIAVPVSLTVARMTGPEPLITGIFAHFAASGTLSVSTQSIIARDVTLRAAKASGTLDLSVDPRNGRYDVGVRGAIAALAVRGLGVADIGASLRIAPEPGGRRAAVTGTATARMTRLDNGFFNALTQSLPQLSARVARGSDGVLHLDALTLTSVGLRVAGAGYRRRDGIVHFGGTGDQTRYGAFTLALDGALSRPAIALRLARPADGLGLRDVAAQLVPEASGYSVTASGGSTLGDFTAHGQLLLPTGAPSSIAVAALRVADFQAGGHLRIVEGGVDGKLDVSGPARGAIGLSISGGDQRVEAHLDADDAAVMEGVRLRRGRLDVVALLGDDGPTIDMRANGTGLRRGNLVLGRFALAAALKDGTGRVTAEASGTRGRAFTLRGTADVTPNRYRITADGALDGRPIALATPAMVTRAGAAWLLAPVRIGFAGGEAEVGGKWAADALAVDATLSRMPMSVLDLAYPGAGLSGSASGRLRYASAGDAAPTGRVTLTVRGLSRAGLVLASQPIDLGLAGVLTAESLGLRAVMASGGKTIGRAQAQLLPQGTGDLLKRLENAPIFGQIRYDGPADSLWRLTGIELFDLSGPVAIGADVAGRANDPRITGALRAKGARIESARTGTVLTNVTGAGSFAGSVLRIDNFAADAGKGGRVTGRGAFDFAAAHGFGIDLSLQAAKAVMINRDDIGATVSGPITIRSNGDGGVIAGDVQLDASRYRLGQGTAATAVPRLAVREINLPGEGEAVESARAEPWRLDIRARAIDGLEVSGLGLTSRWSTTMQLGGSVEEPVIAGRADIVRGTFEFSGRAFDISRGTIRFLGNSPPDPAIDLTANADTTGLTASIRVTGQATRPDISFASTPALPQDELLSRLLFGTSITNLSAPEALQLASAIASLQSRGEGLNPINALRRVAGLDRLRILPADTSVGRTTSIAAGKFITRRLYAEIVTDGQGYSATRVEFQITRWLSILSTVSTLGRQSVNVRVSRDY